jgi:hypothetical protein
MALNFQATLSFLYRTPIDLHSGILMGPMIGELSSTTAGILSIVRVPVLWLALSSSLLSLLAGSLSCLKGI